MFYKSLLDMPEKSGSKYHKGLLVIHSHVQHTITLIGTIYAGGMDTRDMYHVQTEDSHMVLELVFILP